jgi:S1-C subfamily serine protease
MPGVWVLDVLLVLILLGYLFAGYRSGFVRSVSAFVGVAAGAVAAYFAIPLVNGWVPATEWRVPAVVVAAVALVLVGHALGSAVGRGIRDRLRKTPLSAVDHVLGAGVNAVAAALIASLLALSVTALGIPVFSQAIGASTVLRTIDTLTPDPVEAFLARLRSSVVDDGIPLITEALGGITTSPELPVTDTGTPALTEAARSVVRITGNAFECGQNQSGSGFVVAADRVVTNAHVVAGVTAPIVEVPGEGALPGRIVYFDAVKDLAVIAVDALPAAPLALSPTLAVGTTGVIDGYPFGGPFSTGPAKVLSVATSSAADIYGRNPAPREVYTLAADVRSGNSGGPLLTDTGAVAGVVFAKSAELGNVGYALTMTELNPVAAQAPELDDAVASGACTRG